MKKLFVSLAQMEAPLGKLDLCLETIDRLYRSALTVSELGSERRNGSGGIVCFPEAVLGGYDAARADDLALDAKTVYELLGPIVSNRGPDLFCGFIEQNPDGKPYISHMHVSSVEKRYSLYRKTHLGAMEKAYFSPGQTIPLFQTPAATVGIQLCFESHFPELSTVQALGGAELILMPFASPVSSSKRREVWLRTLPARACDNGVFVAACNQTGGRFGGGAMVIDPRGRILGEDFTGGEGLLSLWLDEEEVNRPRAESGTMADRWYLRERRPELYGPVVQVPPFRGTCN